MNSTITKITNMTKTHLNNIMQILVFKLNDGVHYGINVSKIRSIEDFNKFRLIKNDINNSERNQILEGYIKHQDNIIPLLNVEKWLLIYTKNSLYREILVTEFNRHTIAFPINDVLNIYNIPISDLKTSHSNKDVVTYSAIIQVDGEDVTVLILDVEELLVEVFGIDVDIIEKVIIDSNKKLLIAEDSKSARHIIKKIMECTNIEYELFENGYLILEYLKKLNQDEVNGIGLVITDLEMPIVDGYQVVNFIQKSEKFKHIPVLINSSMSNDGVKRKTKSLGSIGFIAKTDPVSFIEKIKENILK